LSDVSVTGWNPDSDAQLGSAPKEAPVIVLPNGWTRYNTLLFYPDFY
jgi:hypothetical protein